jgi:hypothetical protein
MYKNRILDFADRYPLLAFFIVPIGMNLSATFLHGTIRKYKTGSVFSGIGASHSHSFAPGVQQHWTQYPGGSHDSKQYTHIHGIGAGEEEEQVNPLSGVRTEGGDDLDMMFRAHAPTGPATSDLSEFEQIQPRPTGAPVRYDEEYHDRVFFSTPSYVANDRPVTQTRNPNVNQSFVFAGMNGLSKINKW